MAFSACSGGNSRELARRNVPDVDAAIVNVVEAGVDPGRAIHVVQCMTNSGHPQPWWIAIVFSVENPYSASKPFSRPWPECLTPPNGSSMPPPAP